MLRGSKIESEGAPTGAQGETKQTTWRDVDRALRGIAKRRASLDAEEARWLRQAETLQIWKQLGMVSALDYMERVLGYAPRTAQDRLRVARALDALPKTSESFARGALSFTAVRELTRVATPATEQAWIDAAVGRNVRDIEELVAARRPGDLPTDPGDPRPRVHVVRLELQPETYAALRQARHVLEEECGRHIDDDELVALLAHRALDGEADGRARYQISIQRCDMCKHATQIGAGARIAIGEAAVERAECDAQRIGNGRAKQQVPPAVQREVWRRDGGRCRVPGCRSARALEIHHIIHRENGGTHELANLILACSSCHQAHHDRRITISGTADALEVKRPGVHVGARSEATQALVRLGWKRKAARRAVDAAVREIGECATAEPLVRKALAGRE